MWVAVRFMQGEVNAIAEIVGPFDTHDQAVAFTVKHWAEYSPDDMDWFELSSPNIPA
jgi:hypothetical protein